MSSKYHRTNDKKLSNSKEHASDSFVQQPQSDVFIRRRNSTG
jgi:hypothetical protein